MASFHFRVINAINHRISVRYEQTKINRIDFLSALINTTIHGIFSTNQTVTQKDGEYPSTNISHELLYYSSILNKL